MYLKRNAKRVNGATYEYWSLVENVRTARGPRQRTVATLGKLPGLDEEVRVGWEHIGAILDGRLRQRDFLRLQEQDPPEWATVNVSGARLERKRSFGDCYLGLALWRRLKLDRFFNGCMERGREEIPWASMACILALARFCAPSSELRISDFWYGRTALDDLLGVPSAKVNDDRLYRGLDQLLGQREGLFHHLQKTYGELFGTTFDVLLYDITSTYFEGAAAGNAQAKRGYSRDHRPDCVQVCIGLVVTPDGLPLAYEVFDGNRSDVTTVEDILAFMENKYGQARRTWVMDRGMVSESNLEMLRRRGASYLVGTPKSQLRAFEKELLDKEWTQITKGLEVKLCSASDGSEETYVLCRSEKRREKERAMRQRAVKAIEKGLDAIAGSCQTGRLRDPQKAALRLGRLLGRHSRGARFFEVTFLEQPDTDAPGKVRLKPRIERRQENQQFAELSQGCYLLRTNLKARSPEELWKTYIGLTEVEEAFRTQKHDLGLRPIYHQKQDRTQAHILVCFLALAMQRTLQKWMETSGLGTAPRKLLEEMAEVVSLDLILPVADGSRLRLRIVTRPEPRLAILLQRLALPLPNKPKRIPNVVANCALQTPKKPANTHSR